MTQSLRVALIDWNTSVRSARRQIVDATPGLEVVFESDGNSDQFLQLPNLLVDVIVIDQQLEQGSGIEAFLGLRENYGGLPDVPPTVLTTTFDLLELRLLCLASGMQELVSVEAGPEGLTKSIFAAASRENLTDLWRLAELIGLSNLAPKSNFGFIQSVNALPVRKRAIVEKLAREWPTLQSGSGARFPIDQLETLVRPLGCLTASELVIRLFQNGFLNGS